MINVNQANQIREIAKDDTLMNAIMLFETLSAEQKQVILAKMDSMVRANLTERKGA